MTATTNKLRILAIHGYRQSDSVFSGKIGSFRKGFKQQIDFQFIRAPHLVPPLQADQEEETAAEGYGWWFNSEERIFRAIEPSDTCFGFEESLALIEKKFHDDGPFDGILGFSQGAAFVAILCTLQEKKLSPIKFDFAVLISGFKSLCKPHEIYYDDILTIPTLHVYGETDRIIPTGMAKELSDMFENKKVVIHEGGHYVPGKKNIYVDFFQEMSLAKSTVE